MPRTTYASLMDAIQSNDIEKFRSILKTEGLPRSLWWLDYDLLTKALDLNRRVIVDCLLETRCCVWKPYDKSSPLHIAVAKADMYDVVEKLLCLGARASAKDANGDTPVHVAFKTRAPSNVLDMLIQCYLDETSVNIGNKDGLGVLHIACTRPKMEFVKHFLQFHRKSIDEQVLRSFNSLQAGYTALHFAVEHGRHEIVGYLLERGADLYAQDKNGSTPLHLALECCDLQMIDLICYYVTKFDDIANNRGLTHFMAACACSDPTLIEKYLTVASIDSLINNQVKDVFNYAFAGYTPLHFAAVYDRVHIARLLLYCHGEELFWAATARNHTASSLAFESQRYRVANLFSMYCEGGDAWMREVRKIDEGSVVRKVVEKLEEESFSSCCDFDFSKNIVKTNVKSECIVDDVHSNENNDSVNLDDTLPLDEYDEEDDDELVEDNVKKIVDHEKSIHVTPRSTRSLYGKRDEMFMARVHEMHMMSRRLFYFNVDRADDDLSRYSKFLEFLSVLKPVAILVGTLLLMSLSVLSL